MKQSNQGGRPTLLQNPVKKIIVVERAQWDKLVRIGKKARTSVSELYRRGADTIIAATTKCSGD